MLSNKKKEELKKFNELLDQEPEHCETSEADEDGKTYKHIPIAHLEEDLANVYNGLIQHTKVKIKEHFGYITISMNLKVFHPVMEKWLNYGGVAGVKIESEAAGEYRGTTKMLVVEDLKTGIALCYSEAIKNAAKKIPGKRFGSDLNRPPKTIKTAFDENPFDPSSLKSKRDITKAVVGGQITKAEGDLYNQCLIEGSAFPPLQALREGFDTPPDIIQTADQVSEAVKKVVKTKKGGKA